MKRKKWRKEKQNVVIETRHTRLTLKDMQNAEEAQSFLRTESIFGTSVSRMSRGPATDWILCSACFSHLHVKLMNEIRVKDDTKLCDLHQYMLLHIKLWSVSTFYFVFSR